MTHPTFSHRLAVFLAGLASFFVISVVLEVDYSSANIWILSILDKSAGERARLEKGYKQLYQTYMPPVDRVEKKVVHKVLLFTYMRGGSTFLGQLFNQNPDACYWFEPGIGMYESVYGPSLQTSPLDVYYNPDGTRRLRSDGTESALGKELKDLLNMNIDDLPPNVVNYKFARPDLCNQTYDYFACIKSRHLPAPFESLHRCGRNFLKPCEGNFSRRNSSLCVYLNRILMNYVIKQIPLPAQSHLDRLANCQKLILQRITPCVNYLFNACAGRKTVAIKVIRMNMVAVREALKLDKDIKLVHYIRDPRGIILSRSKVPCIAEVSQGNLTREATFLCRKMIEDIKARKEIERKLPNRVMTVRYEDYARDPLRFARSLYSSLDITFHLSLHNWIKNNTRAEEDDRGVFSTGRKNSSATAWAWKSKFDKSTMESITKECKVLLQEMDYPLR